MGDVISKDQIAKQVRENFNVDYVGWHIHHSERSIQRSPSKAYGVQEKL
jgi:hypothetical protein